MNVHELILQALKLMGTGMGMVFVVLAIFYGLVKALIILFPDNQQGKGN